MTNHTETSVLAQHGIVAGEGQNLTDVARAAGLIFACLGCGSISGINVNALATFPDVESARIATRNHLLDLDPDGPGCCPDADTILY